MLGNVGMSMWNIFMEQSSFTVISCKLEKITCKRVVLNIQNALLNSMLFEEVKNTELSEKSSYQTLGWSGKRAKKCYFKE